MGISHGGTLVEIHPTIPWLIFEIRPTSCLVISPITDRVFCTTLLCKISAISMNGEWSCRGFDWWILIDPMVIPNEGWINLILENQTKAASQSSHVYLAIPMWTKKHIKTGPAVFPEGMSMSAVKKHDCVDDIGYVGDSMNTDICSNYTLSWEFQYIHFKITRSQTMISYWAPSGS